MKAIYKNSLIFIVCEIFSKAMPFLMLPYLSRVLSINDFGQLGLFTSLQALTIILVNFSFEGAIARYFYRYGYNNLTTLIFHSFSFVIFLGLIVFSLSILLFPDNRLLHYAIVVSVFQSVFNILTTSKQCQKKVYQYALYQISFSLLSVLLTVILFNFISFDTFSRINAILLSLIVCALVFILFEAKRTKKLLSFITMKRNLLYMLSFGLPLIIHQSSLYFKGQFDRLLISHTFSINDLATYTAAFQLASVVNVGIMALNKALVPYYFEACKNERINVSVLRKYAVLAIPFSIVPGLLALLMPDALYSFVLGSKYSNLSSLVALFTIGFGLQAPYLIIVNFLFYHNRNRHVATATFTSSLIHLMCLFFFKQYGIGYLPYSLIISNSICIIMLYYWGINKNGKT
ncbi:oligosaccharide flippase family protein [Erwinia pyri]|uniref:Oligosaccharide flippase family protein n=1 Tax=Erwinia pyri TaxID=3062598 RepID=A0AA50DM81_9GAMM|nr:oligosaccharide flippase family protein [Erwinia sp. DE2]WLS80307.1 oligosaccharide flippase family protein [Erwinia sp. DE2]